MGLIPPLKGGRQEAAPPGWLADPLVAQDDLAGGFLWWLLGAVPNHRRLGWDLAVVLLCQRSHLFRRDRAGDYQDGVVGRVPAFVESHNPFDVEGLDVMFPADYRIAVRMVEKQCAVNVFAQDGAGVVVDPLAAFFQDN